MTKKKEDGTRSGRMTGGGPGAGPTIPKQTIHQILYEDKVPLRDPEPPILAEGGKTPTGRSKTTPQFIDFETRSEAPMRSSITQQVIEAAMARWPGRTLEQVDLPDGAVGLRPYQREMLRHVMEAAEFEKPVEGDTYAGFKGRYYKGGPLPSYGGKMRDYMRQLRSPLSAAYFATGSASFLEGTLAQRRFFVMRAEPNRFDDVFERQRRRFEAKLRGYCMSELLNFGDYAAIERSILTRLLLGYTPHTRLLTGPYGWASGQGTGILIQYMSGSDDHPWPTRQEADMISGIFVSYGCAPKYAKKAADCLYGSGQYSCIVTVSKLALRNLKCAMEVVGCAFTITQHPGEYRDDEDKDFR